MATPNGSGRLITGINVTPLVDVTLVLLVIMMVTASYIVAQSIPVDLPRASSGEAASSLDRARRLHLGSEALSESELRARIRSAHVGDREVRAVISADGALPHRDVIHVVDVLRQEGVTRFAINVEPDPVSVRAK